MVEKRKNGWPHVHHPTDSAIYYDTREKRPHAVASKSAVPLRVQNAWSFVPDFTSIARFRCKRLHQ